MDLSKLSDADLQALQSGDMSKVSDEALSHISGKSAAPKFGDSLEQMVPDKLKQLISGVTAARGGLIKGMSAGNIPIDKLPGLREAAQDNPGITTAGELAGNTALGALTGGAAEALAPAQGLGLMGRVARAGAEGAALGGAQKPAEGGSRLANAALGMGVGAGGTVAAEGLGKAGDFLMQRAVGRKKYTPGVGTTLADEGIIGTKGMMRKQVANQMDSRGEEIGQLASQIPTQIDSEPVAQRMLGNADSLVPSTGAPSIADQPKIDKIADMAADVSSRGQISPVEALERRRIAGQRAFRKDDPLESLLGKVSKDEQAGYSDALKQGYRQIPDAANPEALAEADNAYSALAKAKRPLNDEPSLAQSMMSMGTKTGLGALLGYGVGGKEGAVIGAALGSPLGQSTAGQGAVKSSQLIPQLLDPALAAALARKERAK